MCYLLDTLFACNESFCSLSHFSYERTCRRIEEENLLPIQFILYIMLNFAQKLLLLATMALLRYFPIFFFFAFKHINTSIKFQ
jgi:hypothetical protein